MYPDLSYLFHDIFGTQPDNWTSVFKTFGVMLVVAILSAAWFFYLELKRKAEEGLYQATTVKTIIGEPASPWDIASNALFGFLVGFKFVYIAQNFAEFQQDAAAVLLSLKGNWLAGIAGAALFGFLRWQERKKQVLPKPKEVSSQVYPHDRIGDLTIMAAVTGILGAKIFAILEEPSGFFDDPIGTFFSGSGLAIYGGLIGGYLGVTWYMRKHNIPFWPTADAVAPALIISYGVGRIGCQLSGDGDWGIDAAAQPGWWFLPDWLWAYDYPHNVNKAGIPIEGCEWLHCTRLANPVYPTPIYEVAASFLIGGILWAMRKRTNVQGMIFFTYLILNGFERFWIEKIRVNATYKIAGFEPTQAEIIAVVLFLIGVAGVIWRKRVHARA
ncbi:MAG: prolipoprotein diacylglyceryl transferase [Saprospiraceae bacterium]|jgi:prolipoprotein diacylglyceryl transferase|nr:prolipoprotein diacylglyceryl transferase [Saprospiraceae bacterium]